MTYKIELAATAKADLGEIARWIRDQVSPAAADQWLAGLMKAADTLKNNRYAARSRRSPINFPRRYASYFTASERKHIELLS
jgi:plasmid stabilization system protein ParE